ncbi:hypothetical protein MJO28_009467 [Puccinia striiformis f. sp. tritici]|uniref:Uncharacterized protein n=2 Tax=Puccinia striiformis f. sp. tritici TaxID=168172 RepID=A0ACC0EAD8_9BASI|nr:hypothetical protein Pst134EA_017660 [Puccinia striiformis f. sp. tritici]KAH9461351.1 hypothetical protein Pst134EA_017660 [Puccinia striiformis f. sp. tritici]KAI7947559.1 hypothetical protein MJO28_009467 [Puccinia striiformis f. sp. tritici]
MFRGAQIVWSIASVLSWITQHSGSNFVPAEITDAATTQPPGVLNASSYQTPSSLAESHPPVAITPLNPDVVAKQIAADRINIPVRPAHPSGAGAYGTFTVTTNFAKSQTMMDLFSNVGQKTPVTVRFSNALGDRGGFDTARDTRGFAMKFHTKHGIWDLLSNNCPVFFIRDPAKFPAFLDAQGRDPVKNLRDADRSLNFFASNPESMNLFLRFFSSAGTPGGWHRTNSWSVNTYRWYRSDGTWSYVKLNFETQQGVLNFTAAEQSQIKDPGYAARELYSLIKSGKFPRWKLYAQVLSAKEAENFKYNVLDATKTWPTSLVAQHEIGVLELNKNPADYLAEVEKQAFSPANIVPGWAASHDPVLQMRMAIYTDSSRYRTNGEPSKIAKRDSSKAQIPIGNSPLKTPKNSAQLLSDPSAQGIPGDSPTDAAPKYDYAHSLWINQALESMTEISPIDFEQPASFYGNLTQPEKMELIQNIAGGLSRVSSSDIRTNLINWLAKASADLSQQVAMKLKTMTG